ncbi:hypothetical protein LX36DRAFT_591910 [Colletotrichum falcatum]|nr:hypothetical protein LX36DRAFT_591910 [Colletotrichum falcatum]
MDGREKGERGGRRRRRRRRRRKEEEVVVVLWLLGADGVSQWTVGIRIAVALRWGRFYSAQATLRGRSRAQAGENGPMRGMVGSGG